MKSLSAFGNALLLLIGLSSCSSLQQAMQNSTSNDDAYYSLKDARAQKVYNQEVKVEDIAPKEQPSYPNERITTNPNAGQNYQQYNSDNGSSYQSNYVDSINAMNGGYGNSNYSSGFSSSGYGVTNNYYGNYNDYGSNYETRIRRFGGGGCGFSYYDPYYTGAYAPIYSSGSFSVGLGFGLSSYYGWGCYDPFTYRYPYYYGSTWYNPYWAYGYGYGYGYGYNPYYYNSYWNGYYNGYYDHGTNQTVYHGPRNTRRGGDNGLPVRNGQVVNGGGLGVGNASNPNTTTGTSGRTFNNPPLIRNSNTPARNEPVTTNRNAGDPSTYRQNTATPPQSIPQRNVYQSGGNSNYSAPPVRNVPRISFQQNNNYSQSEPAPSRSYSAPQNNYSSPSYSSPSFGNSSGGGNYSAPSRSSGGGGGGGSFSAPPRRGGR